MIEPRITIRIPSYHPEFNRLPEESIERSRSEPTSGISEDLSSTSLSSGSSHEAAATSSFPEETFSSPSTSTDPSLTPVTVPNTPLHRRLAAIVQRVMMRNNPEQQILAERANFKKNYDSFVDRIGKDSVSPPPPPYYREGMRLLGNKVLSPAGKNQPPVSKVDLMMNPHAYFSKSDTKVLKALQSFLLNKILTAPHNRPLHENDWWALEHLPCVTMDETSRNSLMNTAADFKDVLTKNSPLYLLRHELKEADQASAANSKEPFHSVQRDYNDPYYKSRWETACDDSEILGPANDTIEIIKNNQADIASLFRKWSLAYVQQHAPSSTNKHDTTNQIKNDGSAKTKIVIPKKSVQAKYQEEYRNLSLLRQKLENIHDDLFIISSRAFGKLAKKGA